MTSYIFLLSTPDMATEHPFEILVVPRKGLNRPQQPTAALPKAFEWATNIHDRTNKRGVYERDHNGSPPAFSPTSPGSGRHAGAAVVRRSSRSRVGSLGRGKNRARKGERGSGGRSSPTPIISMGTQKNVDENAFRHTPVHGGSSANETHAN